MRQARKCGRPQEKPMRFSKSEQPPFPHKRWSVSTLTSCRMISRVTPGSLTDSESTLQTQNASHGRTKDSSSVNTPTLSASTGQLEVCSHGPWPPGLAVKWKQARVESLLCPWTDLCTIFPTLSLAEPAGWHSGTIRSLPVLSLATFSPVKWPTLSLEHPTSGTTEPILNHLLPWSTDQQMFLQVQCLRRNMLTNRERIASAVHWWDFSFPDLPTSQSSRTHMRTLTQRMSGIAGKVNTRPTQIGSENTTKELTDLDHTERSGVMGVKSYCLKQILTKTRLAFETQSTYDSLDKASNWL